MALARLRYPLGSVGANGLDKRAINGKLAPLVLGVARSLSAERVGVVDLQASSVAFES